MNKLLKCAKKVLDRYDGDGVISYLQDSDVMEPLRQAVQEAETYKPMTNYEHYKIWASDGNYMPSDEYSQDFIWEDERKTERAVVARLGLKWGGE